MKENKLVIDLDNTITIDNKSLSYPDKKLNDKVKASILESKKNFDITILTARNMKSLKGDLNKIHEITKPIAIKWLSQNEVPFDDIIFGKPYCGEDGHYVDDKNISIEEFIFKFSGPFKDVVVDVVVPFYNEEGNILKMYYDLKKLERVLHIGQFIFVNNGSSDGSKNVFEELKDLEKKLTIVDIKINKGYGYGIKEAFKKCTSDYILLNHSDRQFDAYSYLLTHLESLSKLNEPTSIFSIRKNRPVSDTIFTFILRMVISMVSRKNIKDFNGQPKIMERKLLGDIDGLPDDYTLDLMVYKRINPQVFFPIIEKPRDSGVSSWNRNLYGKFKIFKTYITTSLK